MYMGLEEIGVLILLCQKLPVWRREGKFCEANSRPSIFENPTICDTSVGPSAELVKGKGVRTCHILWQWELDKDPIGKNS